MQLSDVMKERGVTQAALALELGISQPSVSRMLEKGRASVEVALAVETWSRGAVAAETLNASIAAARRPRRQVRARAAA